MPLPPALLARLQKRGIISDDPASRTFRPEQEEVIAEDYDNEDGNERPDSDDNDEDKEEECVASKKIATVTGCPNKTNLYHDCTEYCEKTFGEGQEVPSPTTERRYRNLLRRFPLPNGWQDVWEPGLKRYYFWNTSSDEVSWFPPLHPKAHVTMSITRMRALLRPDRKPESRDQSDASSDSLGDGDSDSSSESEDESDSREEKKGSGPTRISEFKLQRQPNRRLQKRNDLDPMDPAAYSEDCPRGGWADGLRSERDGDRAADSTAAGPLFQQRPYPSPGDVLRINQKK